MTNFIPIFPLGIVVYPGEALNLHIFEPRYRQLITECHEGKKPFGIPSVLNDKLCDMGTLVEITEITRVYEDGKMDIKTKGLKVFRILELINSLPEKLYSGAIVNYPDNAESGNLQLMQGLIKGVRELFSLLKIEKQFSKPDEELSSYDLAHHVGLTLPEEYEFLELLHELQRQEYLKRHLLKAIPLMAGMETLKERVKLNGHFKQLKGFDGL
ncbi:MAG: LON peptidase substrate-binding domain-containing protein [Chitinophagaceae bacterium]|nr:LON peptidase substrate-binding domain-containing protein [Chitinophagaceae bacterium]